MPYKFMTVTFIENDNEQILLGRKLRRVGVGKLNGPGGRVEEFSEPGEGKLPKLAEEIKKSAVRETKEESNLDVDPNDLELKGSFKISFKEEPDREFILYIYTAKKYKGEPGVPEGAKDEIDSWQWIDKNEINKLIESGQFMESDKAWLPQIIKGEKVRGLITFNNSKEFKPIEVIVKSVENEAHGELRK